MVSAYQYIISSLTGVRLAAVEVTWSQDERFIRDVKIDRRALRCGRWAESLCANGSDLYG